MKRKLILHIGLRKTGSSALQEILASETALLHTHGLDYPDRLTRFPAHQELSWCLMNPLPAYAEINLSKEEIYDHYCSVIDANIKADRTTILSSEDLSLQSMDFSTLSYLKERFSCYDPLVTFFARDPISYHISNYKHALVEGWETRSFTDYVFNINSLMYPEHVVLRDIWRTVFGAENIHVLPYQADRFREQSIFSFFLEKLLGIEIEDQFLQHRSNFTIPNSSVDLMLMLNRSDLPQDSVRDLKNLCRQSGLGNEDADFLDRYLTEDQRQMLHNIYRIPQ